MGILNVTPDSFSDGGSYFDTELAVARGLELVQQGADFLDIGGESTRPGSDPVTEAEEIRRVVPVIERLSKGVGIPLSVDTYKSNVARAALRAGASVVNDISGMTYDPAMIDVICEYGAAVVLMHVLGTPKTMQVNPTYDYVVHDVYSFLEKQAWLAHGRGVRQIIVDPGLGFGKGLEDNYVLMRRLGEFNRLGYPLLVGPSRKSFIGKLLDLPVDQRLEGTAAAVTACILRGAHIVRVHDVREMKRVAVVADALKETGHRQ
ncbi:MAG: dihydropteroate synthase [Ignavibacteriales bacterium]|nr:dihydropteroate synthase [Ignavibacteriales bacterium]